MKAIFKTQSNYESLNGKELPVCEIAGTRISCKVYSTEFDRYVTIDFCLSELVRFVGAATFDIPVGFNFNLPVHGKENN